MAPCSLTARTSPCHKAVTGHVIRRDTFFRNRTQPPTVVGQTQDKHEMARIRVEKRHGSDEQVQSADMALTSMRDPLVTEWKHR